jgi:AbrB family looped-hinge helix DNA binding protein
MGTTSRLTSKGQITVPKRVRERLGLRAGDELEFVEDGDTIQVRKRPTESRFAPYVGYLKELAGQDVDAVIEALRGPALTKSAKS